MADIFDYMIDNNPIEIKNNIELQTFNFNNSFNFLINNTTNKFDLDKLSININEQFQFISKSAAPKEKKGTKYPKNSKKDKKYISNNDKKYLVKKRGRPIKTPGKKSRKNPHDRKCPCNIRTRLTIAYFSFLIQFINSIIELILCEDNDVNDINQYKLKKINHSKNISKKLIKNLKKQKIKQIVSYEISSENINDKKNENEEKYQKIIGKNKILETIFNQYYMEFFQNIFYQNKREVNLKKYGINKKLFLNSNVVLYKDFINNIKNKEKDGGEDLDEYLALIAKGVKNYLSI